MSHTLCVVAHPDDEVLLAGATLARLADEGNEVAVLALGGTRRDETSTEQWDQFKEATTTLGVEIASISELPDQRFDTLPLVRLIAEVEQMVGITEPDLVITHFIEDLNYDHRLTARATLTALRPITKRPTILMGETLSSTEWGGAFKPNWYEDAFVGLERKVEAMKVYEGELREPPHPRSERGIRTLARMRGMEVGLEYAEAFQLERMVHL